MVRRGGQTVEQSVTPIATAITLERFGYLKVRVIGDKHCGAASAVAADGTVDVKYTVRITVPPNDLDPGGFIVDQEKLHQVLTTLASDPAGWGETCEQLVWAWGTYLTRWVNTENLVCYVRSMTLTLSPAPHAGSFTATFGNP